VNGPTLAAAFAVGLVLALALYLVVATYNDVVALQRRIDKAWANIEVVLQQRFDQLPNLVEAVRGLLAFERDVLIAVTEARAAFTPAASIPDQASTSAATTRAVRSLLATVERYPEIRSARNVLELQEEIERLESMIADRRELYNDQVYRYNTRIGQVPGVLLAGVFGWQSRPFFDAEPAADRVPSAAMDAQPEARSGTGPQSPS
jgi:LemA protein